MSYTALHDPSGRFVGVTRDGLQIPADPANGDWREFLAWNDLAPEPVSLADLDPPTPVELLARVRAEALPTLPTRADVTGVQVRAALDAVTTSINDRLTFLFAQAAALAGTTSEALEAEFGRPARVLAPEILAYIAANPTAGDPAPTE